MPNTVATAITPPARLARGYAEALLKGVKPADFAREPKGVRMNHPAWCYGHLSIYPNRVLEMVGRADLVKPRPQYEPLFANKTESRDDPQSTIYPPMEEITAFFMERYDATIAALAETDDASFAKPNPLDGMRDRLPTVGAMANFMMSAHVMVHLGQVSAWRRMMGLGSAM